MSLYSTVHKGRIAVVLNCKKM